jgi:hypothetical protein
MTQASVTTRGRLRHAEITRRILVTFLDVYNELGTGFEERPALTCQRSTHRCETTTPHRFARGSVTRPFSGSWPLTAGRRQRFVALRNVLL